MTLSTGASVALGWLAVRGQVMGSMPGRTGGPRLGVGGLLMIGASSPHELPAITERSSTLG